jgi:hypothetical protein
MRVRFVDGLGGLAVVLAGARFAPADEGVARVLLDQSLQSQPIRLVAITTRSLTYIDARGQVRTEGLDRYIALLPAPEDPRAAEAPSADGPLPPTTTVDLADGQRFAGHPMGRPGDGAILEWSNPDFVDHGIMPIPLELVRRITLGPTARAPKEMQAGARDVLVLVNGDTLDGFVESIGDPTRIGHDGAAVDIPLERIAEIRLGGPAVPPSGLMIWLASGSVARVSSLSTDGSSELKVILAPMDSTGSGTESLRADLPLARLHAAAFDMARLAPLAAIAPSRQEGSPERVFSEPLRIGPALGAVLGAPDIEFPGPMTVSWTLPAGAERLGGVAELPEACRTWGDCILVMTIGTREPREVFRARLSAESPRAEFNIALPAPSGSGSVLTATVEAGLYGPIQDRVVLERAVLLLSPEQHPSSRPGR